MPFLEMGMTTRNTNQLILRQHNCGRKRSQNISPPYQKDLQQAYFSRLHNQRCKIQSNPFTTNSTSGLSDQLLKNDTFSPSNQDQGSSPQSITLNSPPIVHNTSSCLVYRQSTSTYNSCLSSMTHDPTTSLNKECSTHEESGLRHQLCNWNSLGFLPTTPQHEIYTDAAMDGWGIVSSTQTWKGLWTDWEKDHHINWKQLLVIWKTIHLPLFRGNVFEFTATT
ncbi:hypothetical protein INT45_009256 [Circinella minor]|uniref:Uncharacterized protein n=1 Tax=Circinella minor TaxID=1195481 RepID=A0A8H7RJN5_9FUNG|nr:hypothetical protein INT45_009256 [Circinella minor]